MKARKTLNCESRHEKKEQGWRQSLCPTQIILQNDSNENDMVLAAKQTHG